MPRRLDPTDHRAIADRLRIAGDSGLGRRRQDEDFGWDKAHAKSLLPDVLAALSGLQERLYAEGAQKLLVVLQAMDAGGKDGTLRDVLTGLNPAGVSVAAFGVPAEDELGHDYLWRVHQHTPGAGRITVFNRSHYEDVLVVRVKGLVRKGRWSKRYAHIANFERLLTDEGTAIVKIFLHLSREEQRLRMQDRIDSPDERWKFRAGDLDDRVLWDDYMDAYREAIERTSVRSAPWYVVPADRKWVRNLAVASILRTTLESMDPQYPEPEKGVEHIVVT
ncbi:MAG: polyphosphate kinase 2 family protein [Acidimicrobiia bacterium]|nr:polyphosphate kinase 2 family protein [Acidimicrobiia bacterium]